MNISTILYLAIDELGIRDQITPEMALAYLNEAQSRCFARDIPAFKYEDSSVSSSGMAQLADGRYYLPFPTLNPPVRKLLGITRQNREQVFGTQRMLGREGLNTHITATDFPGSVFVQGTRIDNFKRRIVFGTELPDVTNCRWVYYRKANPIVSLTDNTNLEIPEEWHHRLLVLGVIVLASEALDGISDRRNEWESNLNQFEREFVFDQDETMGGHYSIGLP